MKKGYFPYKFDKPSFWNYIGQFPELEDYAPCEKYSNEAKELTEWHAQQSNNVFHFRKDMLDYCIQDVRVLLSAIQVAIMQDLRIMGFDGMAETCTIAAKTMLYFRHSFLKPNSIGVIPQNGYGGHRNQSIEGLLWILLQEAEHYPGLQHARSTQGEKVISGFPVDGYYAETKSVLQYHGCFFHGCRKCYTNGLLKNNVSGETFEALRTKTMKRTQKMREAGFTVIEKWSCEFTEAEQKRARDLGLDKNIPQLVPKDAFFGGRTEAVNLCSSVKDAEDKEIRYYDVTSEYPFVNAHKSYPIGHPVVLLKHQLPQSNKTWNEAKIFGAVKCSITPPPRLLHPVLPYRFRGALMFPLCRTCCQEKHEGFCFHERAERTLHGTWPSIEIDMAIEMGYILEEVQEAWHFKEQSKDLFKEFIFTLYKAKLEASGFPSGVVSVEQKHAYVSEILKHEKIALDLTNIEFNPGRRQMSKTLVNSFWVCIFLFLLFYSRFIF
jgi:G:T-mismatch repair DNA endonuclease (very short patch repair protein)